MSDTITLDKDEFLEGLPEPLKDAPVTSQTGLAAIALNYALKYHDINTVQDGALYQQYKLEGRNMQTLHLDYVFETAIRIEKHLLHAPSRLANLVLEAVAGDIEAALDAENPTDESGEAA